jgi:glycosyltransferase involved in cell wall biosynthesis
VDKIVIMSPKVTILVPTYNRAEFLPKALESIPTQTYTDFEVIILDDASTDNTKEIIEPFLKDTRLRIITHLHNLGIAKNRNHGISIAKGVYIAMLDSDDVWFDNDKLQAQVAHLELNTDCAVVGTWMVQIDEQGNSIKKITYAETDAGIRKSILYRNHIAQSSVLFRKSVALNVGGYDETLVTMEDHDLWLKMAVRHKLATLPIYALGYRVHQGNITKLHKLRVALEEITVIWRHRREYPGLLIGIIKGVARLVKSVPF